MDQEPQRHEIGVKAASEYPFQVGLNVCRARQARIVAQQAQFQSVGSDAPARRFIGVQQLLNKQARRALPVVFGELVEAAVKPIPAGAMAIGTRPLSATLRTGKARLPTWREATDLKACEAEHLAKQVVHECLGCRICWAAGPSLRESRP